MYSYTDVLLRFFGTVIAVLFAYMTVYGVVVFWPHWQEAIGIFVFMLLTAGVAFSAHRRIRLLGRKHKEFLRRLEGLPIKEALSAARAEAKALPSGLVAHKVRVHLKDWSAFELDAFQFIVASDDHGRARTLVI